ncbi:tyrosine-type recombinase/integrase [Natronococcus occultus]
MARNSEREYEHITPSEALELYLEEKGQECSPATIRSHRSRLSHFIDWFQQETDYTHVHELGGLDIRRFRSWRFTDHSNDTIATQLDTLRVFCKFLRNIDAIEPTLPEKVESPNRGGQRSNEITAERAKNILTHLDRYQYASLQHTLTHLLWWSMCRVGAVHSIDLDDLDLEDGYITLEHRPETGTSLKNQGESERTISINRETCQILRDYIDQTRPEVTDDYDREPLLASKYGRYHRNTLRNHVYAVTRPCLVRNCPHEEDPETCEAAQTNNDACKCDSSESTHAIRRGSISWHLREETGKQTVSDRADVSPSVIDEHYSTLSDTEKADVRREQLPDSL